MGISFESGAYGYLKLFSKSKNLISTGTLISVAIPPFS
jgi:hypothetical protein